MSISSEYPDGILAYDRYVLNLLVHFPRGNVKCEWCPLCVYDRNPGAYRCIATFDAIYFKDKGVGVNCPLEKVED